MPGEQKNMVYDLPRRLDDARVLEQTPCPMFIKVYPIQNGIANTM
jgi:hypothetical protein